MTIRSLLKRKGNTVPVAQPTATVQAIMDQLELDEVSAVVVTDDEQRILGIVSGGDVLRALNRKGLAALYAPVSEVMTADVLTCDVSQSLSQVYEVMDTNRIRYVPIVENEHLCGIINTLDVVRHRLKEIAAEAEALKDYVAGRA